MDTPAYEVDKMEVTEAPSPFLPDTHIQFAWDSTSLGYLKICPRLYYYQMIEGWAPKGENIHLRFGIEYHQALHDYETSRFTGIPHDDAIHDTIRALLTRIHEWEPNPREVRSEQVKTKENLVRTVIWYLDHFKDDPAQTIALENNKPACEVSFRFELGWGPRTESNTRITDRRYDNIEITPEMKATGYALPYTTVPQPYLLCGHLDRVVTFNDEIFVMDRKTTTTTPSSYYFAQYEPNNQMSLYTLASRIIWEQPIRGVIIDVAQVAVGFSRFTRGFTYRTQDQIEEWLSDLEYWLNLAESYAEANYWPQNDTACDKFGGCKFREICSKSPSVRGAFLKSNFEKDEPWNPLKVR